MGTYNTYLQLHLWCVTGPVALSTSCKLIVPGVAVNGTMSITKSELYFEMDDEDAENKKIDPQVGHSQSVC